MQSKEKSKEKSKEQPKERLIFALDVPQFDEALRLAKLIGPHVGHLKIGLELFLSCGAESVRRLQEYCPIFLDLKLHDIPETVTRTAAALAALKPSLLTVHACDGVEILQAAVQGAPGVRIVAVTVLTSVAQDEHTLAKVMDRASFAQQAGCFAVVASGREASLIKRNFGKSLKVITPGIRLIGDDPNDQKRVTTPAQAIKAGADYLVVGRPIRDAQDPVGVVQKILEEIENS